MKKLLLLFGCVSVICLSSVAQIPKYDSGQVNINEASANFTSDGTLNFTSLYYPAYYVPKDSGTATIFCGSLWVGGLDAGRNLHLAAQTYHQNGTDFWPGPIMDSLNYSTHQDTLWNHVWVVLKSTIDSFRAGLFGHTIPASIANWPANGNVGLGEAKTLAPYVDSNHNGTYDPSGGDYPLIRGDMALYTIFNDDRGAAHTESGAKKLGIEVHQMAYQFISTDTALNRATFIHYDIYNRSKNNYDSVYFGNWIDMDIGNGADNLIGCDSANSYWYTYNGRFYDPHGTGQYAAEKGFGNYPSAQSLAYMCDTMTHFIYYQNNFSVQGTPTTPGWYYNYLKSLWGDSTHITYGGTAYGGSTKTNYILSGNPYTLTGWNEISAGDASGDRLGMSSVGPKTLNANTMKSLDVALVFAQPHVAGLDVAYSVGMLPAYINDVKNFYNSQSYGCDENLTGISQVNAEAIKTQGILVYPNPAKNEFYVQFNNSSGRVNITLYNILGEQVLNKVAESQNTFSIPVANLSPGLYILRAQMEDGSILTNKIEISR